MSSAARVTEYVKRGAALLDTIRPGWFNSVNLDTLQIWSGTDCIVAQVTNGRYCEGLKDMFPQFTMEHPRVIPREMDAESKRHGFRDSTYCNDGDLTDEWKRVIEQRRSEPATVTAGDYRYTVVEAVRLGKEIKFGNVEALADLLTLASGGDRDLFREIFA